MPHKLLSATAAVALLLSLAACSSAEPNDAAADCTPTESGSSSDSVEATGDFDTEPEVTFDTPASVTTTERSVLIDGDGDVAEPGSTVTVQYSAFNGTSGDSIETTSYEEDGSAQFRLDEAQLLPGLLSALQCTTVGSRVAAVIPPADAFGAQGSEALGVGADDNLVFVFDVIGVTEPVEALERANGEDQPLVDGIPTVTLAENGAPTVAIPAADPPTELQIAVLKLGDGTTVADGDTVTVHYTGVIWGTGETFDSSWDRGEPTSFPTTGVIPGFSAALVGQTVGSQVIAVIPPAQGYGDTPPEGSGIAATDTLVFVVDILGTE